MRKYALIFSACSFALILFSTLYLNFSSEDSFSCESRYDLTENINENILRSQGLLSAELFKNHLLINLEGLLTSNGDKYIVSRTIAITLKRKIDPSHLFYIKDSQVIRHHADNTPEDIAQKNLFGSQTNDKIIYINHVNDDTILLGTQKFPQYGCRRQQIIID